MSTRTPGSLTAVEQRGIEPVPDAERNGNPLQLFWVWFAANISILGLPLARPWSPCNSSTSGSPSSSR